MNQLQATGQIFGKTVTLKRVSKAAAKKAFCNGVEIYLQSSNMYPFGVWQSVCPIKLDKDQLASDIQVNEYSINLYTNSFNEFTAKNESWSENLRSDYLKKIEEYKAKVINEGTQFDYMALNYSWYNCDSERGLYVSFYIAI